MHHRPEIDGLRAVAVLPVILFHAGFSAFQGGYVGVDVFFVISGYLITDILIREMTEGRFSILRFYERRARRILPALFGMLILCLPFAWAWLLPDQLKDFAESLGSVILFLSNFYFLSQVSYFAPSAELQPLLHTWSLAVEEQYYLVFPLIVALALRRGLRALFWVTLLAALASLMLSEILIRVDAERNFFFTLSRFWELGAGSLCAVIAARRGLMPNAALAALGLALIVVPVFTFDAHLPFPGIPALAPVIGTALIVLCARADSGVGRLLAHPLPVGIGLISYSAYLYHQPLFAFARIRSAEEPGTLLLLALSAASLALGWLSWRFVERPFRGSRPLVLPGRRGAFFALSGVAMAAMVAVAVVVIQGDGMPGRAQERYAGEIGHAAFYRDAEARFFPCTPEELRRAAPDFEGRPRCFQSKPDLPVTVALVGDSHAEHAFAGLADGLPGEVTAIYLQNAVPFRNEDRMAGIYDALTRNPDLKTVVFAMHWPRRYLEIGDAARFEAGLHETLAALQAQGLRVVVAGDLPWFASEPPACKYEVFAGNDRYCQVERADALEVRQEYGPILERVTGDLGIPVVPLRDLFCQGAVCSMVRDGAILYRDSNHLNAAGADLAGGRLAEGVLALP